MKRLTLLTLLVCIALTVFGQDAKLERIYGGMPTENKNMQWEKNLTPEEEYVGVIQLDSSISASKIIEAFILTYRPIQDANIMTKQMGTNNAVGSVASSLNGDYDSMDDFADAGDSDNRRQYQGRTSWTVQFIDGVRLTRFYYNVSVQAKDGRFKLTIDPSGLSGYAQDHVQTEWSRMFRKGEVRGMYSKYYDQMKTKLAYTVDEWITEVEDHLEENANDDW
jgi:hypothetical protein